MDLVLDLIHLGNISKVELTGIKHATSWLIDRNPDHTPNGTCMHIHSHTHKNARALMRECVYLCEYTYIYTHCGKILIFSGNSCLGSYDDWGAGDYILTICHTKLFGCYV